MIKQTIYCCYDALHDIYLLDFKELIDLMVNHSDIVIDKEKIEILDLVSKDDNPILTALIKRELRSPISLPSFFDSIDEYPFDSCPRDIHILDITEKKSKELSNRFGSLVISKGCLSRDCKILFQRPGQKRLKKGEIYSKKDGESILEGWQALLDRKDHTPANAMIIIDNYLFNDINSTVENLISFIPQFIELDLEPTFQVLLVALNNDANFKGDHSTPYRDALVQIKNRINENIGKDIEIGMVFHNNTDEFHERIALLNYHQMVTDKGFTAFNGSRLKHKNKLYVRGNYASILEENEVEIDDMIEYAELIPPTIASIIQYEKNSTELPALDRIAFGDLENRLLI